MSRRRKPNDGELALGKLISKVTKDFKYNGHGNLGIYIGTKIPDFINVAGKKQIILFNGCYWHGCPICFPKLINQASKEYENTVTPYEKLGYAVLVIWEHEMINANKVMTRIKEFVG